MTSGPTGVIGASILQAAEFVRHGRWQQAEQHLTRLLAALLLAGAGSAIVGPDCAAGPAGP